MKWARHPRTKFLFAFLGIIAVVVSLVVRLSRVSKNAGPNAGRVVISQPTASSPIPSPTSLPTITPESSPPSPLIEPTRSASSAPGSSDQNGPANLIIPVAGITANQLRDTYSEARSEGRQHDAIDIIAPRDTAVLATADGKIVKLFQSERGGTTIYELSADEKYFFYYAHLDRYADGVFEGQVVKQGTVIAYVGDTGNAGPGNYHLHFSIAIATDPKRYWDGININPYPLLKK
jgi:murein DD-endopeptidase MepM/ murein hydrolase activator NlpD